MLLFKYVVKTANIFRKFGKILLSESLRMSTGGKGADINHKDNDGWTGLIYGIYN